MGQKVNPHGLRVGLINDWESRWYVKDEEFADTLVSDYKIRKYLKEELKNAGIPKIEIERTGRAIRVTIHCARPGMVIGRGGSEKEKYRVSLEKMLGKPVRIDIVEVRQPDLSAQLVAENVASQLERRISFRRAMKMAIRNTMRLGAKGIKVMAAGWWPRDFPVGALSRRHNTTAYPARRHRLRVRRSQNDLRQDRRQGLDIPRRGYRRCNPAGHKPARAPRGGTRAQTAPGRQSPPS